MLAFSLTLILASSIASEYEYGTKVEYQDTDVGKPTHAFAVPQLPISIALWDTGSVPGFVDAGDMFYLHFGAPAPLPAAPVAGAIVRANDIRLTPFGSLPAGSKVTPLDNDIGMPLSQCPVGGGDIGFLDLYGTSGINDLGDPLIINVLPPAIGAGVHTGVNDIRLSVSEGMPAGTMLRNSDPDFDRVFTALPIWISPAPPGSIFQYFDTNGNNIYDYVDDVYLNFPAVPPNPLNTVDVNDVRISGNWA